MSTEGTARKGPIVATEMPLEKEKCHHRSGARRKRRAGPDPIGTGTKGNPVRVAETVVAANGRN